jgi:hypothetical protein
MEVKLGYSLPRHVEIAQNPEQHRRQRDMLIEELTQDIGYGKHTLEQATIGYGKRARI